MTLVAEVCMAHVILERGLGTRDLHLCPFHDGSSVCVKKLGSLKNILAKVVGQDSDEHNTQVVIRNVLAKSIHMVLPFLKCHGKVIHA